MAASTGHDGRDVESVDRLHGVFAGVRALLGEAGGGRAVSASGAVCSAEPARAWSVADSDS